MSKRIKYYGFNDEITAQYYKPTTRKFNLTEKYYINEFTGKKVMNKKFDQKKAEDHYFEGLKAIAKHKIMETDLEATATLLPDSPLTAAEKKKIMDYRKSLKDHPEKIKKNKFKHIEWPIR